MPDPAIVSDEEGPAAAPARSRSPRRQERAPPFALARVRARRRWYLVTMASPRLEPGVFGPLLRSPEDFNRETFLGLDGGGTLARCWWG